MKKIIVTLVLILLYSCETEEYDNNLKVPSENNELKELSLLFGNVLKTQK
ncbi:hypothetical protein [Psychroflexus montanilacus]|nr:hypothetical protein [Psychroflexus montanilacus]MBZ9652234.1 hypothetical protein [Psychroflexus montanilacus]